jgi:hypothetical protein
MRILSKWSHACHVSAILLALVSRGFLTKMRLGQVAVESSDIPTFMYPFGHVYKANDILSGFGESEIMIRVRPCNSNLWFH